MALSWLTASFSRIRCGGDNYRETDLPCSCAIHSGRHGGRPLRPVYCRGRPLCLPSAPPSANAPFSFLGVQAASLHEKFLYGFSHSLTLSLSLSVILDIFNRGSSVFAFLSYL